jgi:hypothetical protein
VKTIRKGGPFFLSAPLLKMTDLQDAGIRSWAALQREGIDLALFQFGNSRYVVQHPTHLTDAAVFTMVFQKQLASRDALVSSFIECFGVTHQEALKAVTSQQKNALRDSQKECNTWSQNRCRPRVIYQEPRVLSIEDSTLTDEIQSTSATVLDANLPGSSCADLKRLCSQLQVAFDAGLAFIRSVWLHSSFM